MRVLIVGAGMTGLLAASACNRVGIEPKVISKDPINTKAVGGVRYLHDNCQLPLNQIDIETYVITPTNNLKPLDCVRQDEAARLYGEKTGANTLNNSLSRCGFLTHAYPWDSAMFMLYRSMVEPREMGHDDIIKAAGEYDLVVSTIPLPIAFPEASHLCHSRTFYANNILPPEVRCRGKMDNVIYYNLSNADWVRCSVIGGHIETEWMTEQPDSRPIIKVDGAAGWEPAQSNIMLAGRYGEWNSRIMAHQVYYKTLLRLSNTSTPTS